MSDEKATPVVEKTRTSFGLEVLRVQNEPGSQMTALESFGLSASIRGRLVLERSREIQARSKAISSIVSPALLRLYGVRRIDGKHYVEREDLPGAVYLVDYLKDRVVSPEVAVKWILLLAELCGQYESLGLGFRGLSDHNILISDSGEIKVIDPGVSLSLHDFRGDIENPDNFLAPESVMDDTWTPQSDMFVLGVLMYELLTGIKPFDDPARENIVENVLHKKQVDPRYLNPGISQEIAAVVSRLLEKAPSQRYSSIDELCSELRRIIEQRAFEASPSEKEVYKRKQRRAEVSDKAWRGRRWINRNRAAILIAGAVVLALVLLKLTTPDNPPIITADMTAEEVVTAYYEAYAESQPDVLEEILAEDVEGRSGIITRASTVHVILKMQQVYHPPIPVAGTGTEPQPGIRAPFTVDDLQITLIEDNDPTARFIATYVESFIDQDDWVSLSRRDEVGLTKVDSVWRITSLERTVLGEERTPFDNEDSSTHDNEDSSM